jgi:hypothetical protein
MLASFLMQSLSDLMFVLLEMRDSLQIKKLISVTILFYSAHENAQRFGNFLVIVGVLSVKHPNLPEV